MIVLFRIVLIRMVINSKMIKVNKIMEMINNDHYIDYLINNNYINH